MRQVKRLPQASPFCGALSVVLQNVIKLYESLEKNLSKRSNYIFYIMLKFLSLKSKALSTRHNIKNSIINAKLMKMEMLDTRR